MGEQQCLLKAARSPRESECKMIVGFWELTTGVSFSHSAGQAETEQRKPCRISPRAHTHMHIHTPNATILQFPELLNHVIMSLSLPALSSYCTTVIVPISQLKGVLHTPSVEKPPCSEVTYQPPPS